MAVASARSGGYLHNESSCDVAYSGLERVLGSSAKHWKTTVRVGYADPKSTVGPGAMAPVRSDRRAPESGPLAGDGVGYDSVVRSGRRDGPALGWCAGSLVQGHHGIVAVGVER